MRIVHFLAKKLDEIEGILGTIDLIRSGSNRPGKIIRMSSNTRFRLEPISLQRYVLIFFFFIVSLNFNLQF